MEASAEQKAASAKKAMLFSRTNTLLSIPMLYCMVGAQNLYWTCLIILKPSKAISGEAINIEE